MTIRITLIQLYNKQLDVSIRYFVIVVFLCLTHEWHLFNELILLPAAVKGAVNNQHCKLLTASVVALGVLLLSILENKTEELVVEKSILENKTKELVVQKSILENKTDELNRQKDSLYWTMGRILMFNSFPVNDFCPENGCQPCLTGWIPFQEKCYYFERSTKWKTWTESRTYCKDNGADLVVIETLQEQEFISKNVHSYNGDFYGYWIGLKQDPDQNWIWVNGHKDTLEFWLDEGLGNSGPYALVIHEKPPNASWDTSDDGFRIRFICESELMIKSFYAILHDIHLTVS
uniref:C-type lectin domain-containing protein n=1 Tax=Sphaeramia orbicularis TaxID=375764 RepID=A0A673BEX3_9TELE